MGREDSGRRSVEKLVALTQPAAAALVRAMQEAGVLEEATGKRRYRGFAFKAYLALFGERNRRE